MLAMLAMAEMVRRRMEGQLDPDAAAAASSIRNLCGEIETELEPDDDCEPTTTPSTRATVE